MKIEVRATYAATDGSMPEDMSVEIGEIDVNYDHAIAAVMPILDKLITAPSMVRHVDLDVVVATEQARREGRVS